jgi:hypothetical protein
MLMKNLEQIRAASAVKFWAGQSHRGLEGSAGRDLLRQVASMMLVRGLLATAASAQAGARTGQPGAEDDLLLELGQFLASRERGLLSFPVRSTADLVQGLANGPSSLLQQATDEAVLYLGYLARLQPCK